MAPTPEPPPDERVAVLDGLTEKQRRVVIAALEFGFFERPQRATAAEIAEELDFSRSAFLYHLRNAEQIVFERAVESELDDS